jgi:predicted DNA-binding mobile mystery protein A
MARNREITRRQLDTRLEPIRALAKTAQTPPSGWIKAIRTALGMTASQLARRMGVSPQRVLALERAEARGAINLKTLRRAAQALDCTFLYALAPADSLDQIVRKRAHQVAAEQLPYVDHTMRLEKQGISAETAQTQLDQLTEDLARSSPSRLWDRR